ncbi:MAG: FtsX-like permease family protein [Stagnimonas sp.]|nr:FtsX-like permease family protein [Stagnimonas sp.]
MKKFFLEAGPVLRALTRSRAGAVLIALQCAITLAILTNAIFIIQDRVRQMARPSGVDSENVFSMRVKPYKPGFNLANDIDRDMAAIRAMPGIVDAGVINSLPLSEGGSSGRIYQSPDIKPGDGQFTANYYTDDHSLGSLGLKLVEGRGFLPEEVKRGDRTADRGEASIILSQTLAKKMFPGGGPVAGKTLYTDDGTAQHVVGVVERLQAPWISFGELEQAMLLSQYRLEPAYLVYVIRSQPGQRNALMPQVEKKLQELDPDRIIRSPRTQSEIESDTYASYRAMAVILGTVIVLIVAVTSLGIIGLASFNVNVRRKQIGTRRALGAQKGDIIRYFLVESWLITTGGALVGVGLSFALSWWMVNTFDLPPLDWRYVPVGVLFLWVLGQIAVLAPARRAAELPPALATRSA